VIAPAGPDLRAQAFESSSFSKRREADMPERTPQAPTPEKPRRETKSSPLKPDKPDVKPEEESVYGGRWGDSDAPGAQPQTEPQPPGPKH
jgi:hypothetical protein